MQGRVLTGDAVPPVLAAALAESIAAGFIHGVDEELKKADLTKAKRDLAQPKQLEALMLSAEPK